MIFNYYSPQNPVRSVDNGNITNPVLIQRSNLTLHNIWNGSEYTTVSYKNLLNTERCSFYEVTDSNIAFLMKLRVILMLNEYYLQKVVLITVGSL